MNNNDELNMLREKRRKFLKKIFLIGAIVSGIFFLGDLIFVGVNYEFLIDFIFCIMALFYLKKGSINNKNLNNNNYYYSSNNNNCNNSNNYNVNNEKDLYEKHNINSVSIRAIIIIMTIVFVIVLCFIFFAIDSGVNIPIDENTGILCLIVFSCLLPLFFKFYLKSMVKERGRTNLKINVQGDYWEIDSKIKNILSYLYYKEIKYKNSKVYYSYKTREYLLNRRSISRYLKYEIKDGYIEFECWFVVFKEEFPIVMNNNYGIIQRNALINDIKFIEENLKRQ